jgi:hypothetical protein
MLMLMIQLWMRMLMSMHFLYSVMQLLLSWRETSSLFPLLFATTSQKIQNFLRCCREEKGEERRRFRIGKKYSKNNIIKFFSLPPSLRDNISENSEFSEMLSRREGEEAREGASGLEKNIRKTISSRRTNEKGASGLEKNIRKTISSRRTNERTTPMVMAMLIPMPYVDAHANAICRC